MFDSLGLLFEPKRGEFSEAIHQGYIRRDQVLERALFTRIYLIATGRYSEGVQRKIMRKTGGILGAAPDEEALKKIEALCGIYGEIAAERPITSAQAQIATDLQTAVIAYAIMQAGIAGLVDAIQMARLNRGALWRWGRENVMGFRRNRTNRETGETTSEFSIGKWHQSNQFPSDVDRFVSEFALLRPEDLILEDQSNSNSNGRPSTD